VHESRINDILCKDFPWLGTLLPPFIANTIAQYMSPSRRPLFCNIYHTILVLAISCKAPPPPPPPNQGSAGTASSGTQLSAQPPPPPPTEHSPAAHQPFSNGLCSPDPWISLEGNRAIIWPLQDIVSLLRIFCARINHVFTAPSHLHCPHYCNAIARLLCNI